VNKPDEPAVAPMTQDFQTLIDLHSFSFRSKGLNHCYLNYSFVLFSDELV